MSDARPRPCGCLENEYHHCEELKGKDLFPPEWMGKSLDIPIGTEHKKYSATAFDNRPGFGFPRVEPREYVEPSKGPNLYKLFDKIRGQEFDPGKLGPTDLKED
jgi:hypothetical protein